MKVPPPRHHLRIHLGREPVDFGRQWIGTLRCLRLQRGAGIKNAISRRSRMVLGFYSDERRSLRPRLPPKRWSSTPRTSERPAKERRVARQLRASAGTRPASNAAGEKANAASETVRNM